MSVDPPIIKPRKTSVAFRRFNRRHSNLSTHYWTHVLSAKTIEKQLKGHEPKEWAVTALGVSMKEQEYGFNVAMTVSSMDEFMNTTRLHILAICLAQLESFIKDMAYCVARLRDPDPRIGGLSPMAEAMAKPILGVDSLPGPLEYSESFFEVELKDEIKTLNKAYAYRCAAVHNGGYATPKAHKRLGRGDLILNQKISIKWVELKPILLATFDVANRIDLKWGSKALGAIECEVELANIKSFTKLPNRNKVWAVLADAGFRLPHKTEREKIAAFFYSK